MNNLQRNVSKLLKEKGWTQAELSKQSGVEAATISRIMDGRATLVAKSLKKIAKAFDVNDAILLAGAETGPNTRPFQDSEIKANIGVFRVPVRRYSSAHEDADPAAPGEFFLTHREYPDGCFAFYLPDDSMAPEFHEGEVVILDPSLTPEPNTYVLGQERSGELHLRRYLDRGQDASKRPVFELRPLDSGFREFDSRRDEITILGRAVGHWRPLA